MLAKSDYHESVIAIGYFLHEKFIYIYLIMSFLIFSALIPFSTLLLYILSILAVQTQLITTKTFLMLLILYSIVFYLLAGSLFWRKRQAGRLLLSTPFNKVSLFIGILWFLSMMGHTFYVIWHTTIKGFIIYHGLLSTISWQSFYISLSVFFLCLGSSKLELREKGIFYGLDLVEWRKIKGYRWDQLRTNVLKIQLKPILPIFPSFLAVPIPFDRMDAVNQILVERLP